MTAGAPVTRLGLAALACGAALYGLAACSPPTPPASAMAAAPDSTRTFRVGRLLVDLPATARITPSTNGGAYNFVEIEEISWPENLPATGRERDGARAAFWTDRVADAERRAERERERALYNRKTADHIVVADRAADIEGATWARELSFLDENGQFAFIVVAADFGPVLLVSEKKVIAPRLAPALARAASALGGYVPVGAPGYGGPEGLYLRHGVIARPPPSTMGLRRSKAPRPGSTGSHPSPTGCRPTRRGSSSR